MPSLEELITQNLSGLIEGGGLPTEEALYQRQAQAEREGTFGRGLGISTVTRDALAKARMDAALAAQSAQLSALGQAASITQANANRAQQGSQFGQNLAQRNKELGAQESLANKQMLASGIGAGTGAALNLAGLMYRPQIQDFLGVRRGGEPSGNGVPGGQMPSVATTTMPTFADGGGGGGGAPNLADFSASDFGGFDSSFGALAMPDFSGFDSSFGALDLGGLFDYTPYQWGDWY